MDAFVDTDILNYMIQESGRITYDIAERVLATSVFPNIINRKPWPERMGETPQNVEWQRPYIDNPEEWADVTISEHNTKTSCLPPTDSVEIYHKLRSMKLQQKAIESKEFCVTDLIFTEAREKQMGIIVKQLSEAARWEWSKRIRREIHRCAKNKINLNPELDGHGEDNEDTEGFPTGGPPTSKLVNGALDFFYRELLLEGAANSGVGRVGGQPVFMLITDCFTSRKLTHDDDVIREDLRNTSMAETLLQPLGISYTYNGFVHIIDEMPRRWDWIGDSVGGCASGWIEREPYHRVGSGTDNDPYTIEVNPEWINAEYQDSYIYVRDALSFLVPPSISGVAGADYDPQNYMGEFGFRNIPHRTDNPDGTMGFFRGKLMSGTEMHYPQWLYVIRHRVCDKDLGLVNCVGITQE